MTWKAKLKLAYPDPNDYSAFMVRDSGSMIVSVVLRRRGCRCWRWLFLSLTAVVVTIVVAVVAGATIRGGGVLACLPACLLRVEQRVFLICDEFCFVLFCFVGFR